MVYARGFGLADLDTEQPAEAATVYNIASTGKIVAAAAVMKLVESGQLDLDASLASLLPSVPNPDQAQRVTLRHLLSMTSGLSDYVTADVERLATTDAPLSKEFVLDYVNGRPLDYDPGANWIYSNTGFYLAGLVVEEVSGRSWADYVLEQVVRPLGLEESHLCDAVSGTRSRGYEWIDDSYQPSALDAERGVRGDAGLCASVRDLARLPHALAGGEVISQAGLDEMIRPTRLRSGATVDYGLGVSSGTIAGHRLWGHLGGSGSIVSTLAHYPDDDVSIAVLVNTRHARVGALQIEGEVAAIVLGLARGLDDVDVPAEMGAALVGEYVGDREATRYELAYEGLRVVRTPRLQPDFRLPLLHQGGGAFGREDWPFDRFVFHFEGDRATSFSAYYNGFFDGFYSRVE